MNFYQRKRRMPAVIIVSLIDIFAILLIFVIVTSTFKKPQSAVTIKLPESSSAAPQPQEQQNLLELTVDPEGAVKLDGADVELEELSGKIKALWKAGRPLALKADTKAPFGVIVRVLDALKEAGVTGNLPAFTETVQKGK